MFVRRYSGDTRPCDNVVRLGRMMHPGGRILVHEATFDDSYAMRMEAEQKRHSTVNEALDVKYDAASGHNCLPVHQDFSLLTINVALSSSSGFTGGDYAPERSSSNPPFLYSLWD